MRLMMIMLMIDDHDVYDDDDDDDGDDDDDDDDDASPIVIAGPGKTQAFGVYIYISIHTNLGRAYKSKSKHLGSGSIWHTYL